jgi:hypothetical protein
MSKTRGDTGSLVTDSRATEPSATYSIHGYIHASQSAAEPTRLLQFGLLKHWEAHIKHSV